MTDYKRFGLYMVPSGPLFAAGSAWLGWDSAAGCDVPHPQVPGLPAPASALTATPRKYGLHGTLKPPFRLAEGQTQHDLKRAADTFCATRAQVTLPQVTLRRIGRFLALVPEPPHQPLAALAAAVVEAFEPFRAPLNATELAKRQRARLTERQAALLAMWGYPYVMEEFRFHITLTGALEPAHLETTEAALRRHFAPFLGQPLAIGDVALMGEDRDGMFHLLHRYALRG